VWWCEAHLDLWQAEYLGDLSTTPRFGAFDDPMAHLRGYQHVVIEVGDEAKVQVGSPAFYRAEDACERMGRYLILTNSGGAVAASAFLGSMMASGHGSRWAVMQLLFFYAGLIGAGLLVFGQLIFRWKMSPREPEARKIMVDKSYILRNVERWTEPPQKIIVGSYLCLIFGGVAAVIVYLCTK